MGVVSRVLAFFLSPGFLFPFSLLVCVYPGTCAWLRPSLSQDISAFELPLYMTSNFDAVEAVQGDRHFFLLSPGVLLAAVAVLGIAANVLGWLSRSVVAGIFFATLVGCQLSLLFVHPALIVQLARENDSRNAIVSVMDETAQPSIEITAFPRVKSLRRYTEPGSIESAENFVPHGRAVFITISLMALLFVTPGSTLKRLSVGAMWTVAGVLLFAFFSAPRIPAEWHTYHAIHQEQQGNLTLAENHLRASLEWAPSLLDMPRTWSLQGLIDYQSNRETAARQYYVASQKSRNGMFKEALVELERMREYPEWDSDGHQKYLNYWTADLRVKQAMDSFRMGHFDAAEEYWKLAMESDDSQKYRPLYVAALQTRLQGADPEQIWNTVDPLLDRLADRSLKAATHAMIGDCFFAQGEFTLARQHYQSSLDIYSLPKTINYRALRGLLGW